MATLFDLRTRVKTRLAIPTSGDGIGTNANVDDWVNTALRAITNERDWWWNLTELATFVINNGVADLPADCVHVYGLMISGYPIQQVSKADYLAQNVAELPGPFGYAIIGTKLKLVPAPSAIFSGGQAVLLYYRAETTLVANGDVPNLPDAHCDALVDYAAYVGALARQDDKRATSNMASYQAWLRRMAEDTEPKHGRKRVRQIEDSGIITAAVLGNFTLATPTFAGGLIVCTSLTHPTAVIGQVILETDTGLLLWNVDGTANGWREFSQTLDPDIFDLMETIPI